MSSFFRSIDVWDTRPPRPGRRRPRPPKRPWRRAMMRRRAESHRIVVLWCKNWGVPKSWRYPNSWICPENPNLKWMRTGGTPDFRKPPYNFYNQFCIPYNPVWIFRYFNRIQLGVAMKWGPQPQVVKLHASTVMKHDTHKEPWTMWPHIFGWLFGNVFHHPMMIVFWWLPCVDAGLQEGAQVPIALCSISQLTTGAPPSDVNVG